MYIIDMGLTYFDEFIIENAIVQKQSIFNDFCGVFGKKNQSPLPWKRARKIGVPIGFFFLLCQGEHAQKVS